LFTIASTILANIPSASLGIAWRRGKETRRSNQKH
jgi:hypothetical protein